MKLLFYLYSKTIFLSERFDGGWRGVVVILLLLKNVNNTFGAEGTRDKHNYLNIKVYPEG